MCWELNSCSGSDEDMNVFVVFKREHKNNSPYKHLSKAKMLQNASYLVRKCDSLQQSRHCFWHQQQKIVINLANMVLSVENNSYNLHIFFSIIYIVLL